MISRSLRELENCQDSGLKVAKQCSGVAELTKSNLKVASNVDAVKDKCIFMRRTPLRKVMCLRGEICLLECWKGVV